MTEYTVTPPAHEDEIEQRREELRERLEALPDSALSQPVGSYLDGVESLASCHELEVWIQYRELLVEIVERVLEEDLPSGLENDD